MYGKFDDVTATEFLSVQLDMSEFRLTWDNSTAQCFVLGRSHSQFLSSQMPAINVSHQPAYIV
jgi:hypothetical protein